MVSSDSGEAEAMAVNSPDWATTYEEVPAVVMVNTHTKNLLRTELENFQPDSDRSLFRPP